MSSSSENPSVANLRNYLRIPSVHPNISYDSCVKFLVDLGKEMGLLYKIIHLAPGKPAVLLTYPGKNPSSPSILLNSHMDVVPVFEKNWKYQPFAAEKDESGIIYGRGAQDMKVVGMIHLEAVRLLIKNDIKLNSSVHILFVPDEEIGSEYGTAKWVETKDFKQLNVGCVFDESGPSPKDEYIIFAAERSNWSIKVKCPGQQGHGSLFIEDTAGEKMRLVINKLMDFREQEKAKLPTKNPLYHVGDVCTVNLTMLEGGTQRNVVPPELSATFDCRVAPTCNANDFIHFIDDVCKSSGKGVAVEYLQREDAIPITKQDNSNPFWGAMENALKKENVKYITITCPGSTDSRFYRRLGIPAFGFTALNNTPIRVHDDNECVNEKVYLRGITIFYGILLSVGNI